MRLRLIAVVLAVVACGSGQVDTTSTSAVSVPSAVITTTSMADSTVPMEVDDCVAPQVTFATLCEVYQLIDKWHIDRPANGAVLAAAAMEGLGAFETDETEEPPRTLICAVPDSQFTELCNEVQRRVSEERMPVGPAIEAAVLRMTNSALDAFSYYLPPDQVGGYRSNGVVGGIGALLDATDAVGSKCARVTQICELRVVFVLDDNPAAEAGLEPGDVITAVDGTSVDGLGFVEAGTLIAGDETGIVNLSVRRDEETLDLTITRAPLMVPSVEVEVPMEGIGYLRIPDFEADIPQLVNDALDALDEIGYHTVVVDLRDNPGGFVDAAVYVISEFVDGGVILIESDRSDEQEIEALEGGQAVDKRIIVLVNEGTASAAEITAMALRDRRGATIVGTTTYGKHAVQLPFDLDNGGQLLIAIADWAGPSGVSVKGTGLEPDVTVDLPQNLDVEELVEIALESA